MQREGALGHDRTQRDRESAPEHDFTELPVAYKSQLRDGEKRVGRIVPKTSPGRIQFPSSLDFERVVNQYSIQATRDRLSQTTVITEEGDNGANVQSTQSDPWADDEWPLLASGEQDYSTFDEDLIDVRKPIVPPPPPPPRKGSKLTLTRQNRKILGYTRRTATRWILTILTGLMTGLISIFIVACTISIQKWRSNLLDTWWQATDGISLLLFCLYATTNLSLAMLAAMLCLFIAPEAVGSGIPEVKAYLNGVRVKRFTSVQLFLVKIVGTIASISSGLAVGPEGPLVHIGAILGASCTKISNIILRLFPNNSLFHMSEGLWSFVTMDLSHFSTDAERRDLVSIGAAAGFAAAFGAPIGGLLFSMEEASSYFDHSMFLKTLTATAIATFCLAVHHGNLSDYSVISLGNFSTPDKNIFLNRVEELPLYILVAFVGGILGGSFCRAWKMLQIFRQRKFVDSSSRTIWKLCEVAILSLLTSSMTYFIPLMKWSCRPVSENDDLVDDDKFSSFRFHAHQFDCPPGQINELADIVFGSREDAISAILTDPTQFSPWTLVTVGAIFFPLMTITLGVALPSGIFMPTFLIGSSLGGAAGMLFQKWVSPELSPSTFALVGAAALLAGIQRSTVSLCVILVEGTGQVKILMPVIITIVVARYIAELIHKHGLYETGMEVNHYPYLDHEEKRCYDIFQVKDIMSSPPVTIGPRERAQTLVKVLRETEHHGFPVVDPRTQKFMGLVRRDQLVALLECGVFEDDTKLGSSNRVDDGRNDDEELLSRGVTKPEKWTPTPGIEKSPLMKLAYHINDDRYDFVEFESLRGRATSSETLASDEFDTNAWLVSVRHGLASIPSVRSVEKLFNPVSRQTSFIVGDNSLPPLTAKTRVVSVGVENGKSGPIAASGNELYLGVSSFAIVGTNQKGNVYIRWLNPSYKRKWVDCACVMNKGTYTVTEFCPVSKAHYLFTALGLRHLIVLGGETGGAVVGLLTRVNLLKGSIEERTGCDIDCH